MLGHDRNGKQCKSFNNSTHPETDMVEWLERPTLSPQQVDRVNTNPETLLWMVGAGWGVGRGPARFVGRNQASF